MSCPMAASHYRHVVVTHAREVALTSTGLFTLAGSSPCWSCFLSLKIRRFLAYKESACTCGRPPRQDYRYVYAVQKTTILPCMFSIVCASYSMLKLCIVSIGITWLDWPGFFQQCQLPSLISFGHNYFHSTNSHHKWIWAS
jgi:hypothetical protein